MASAGVVGMAEVVSPNSTVTNSKFTGSVAMWSFIWVGIAVLFLLFVHVAAMGRG
jgi:hypothetical protein